MTSKPKAFPNTLKKSTVVSITRQQQTQQLKAFLDEKYLPVSGKYRHAQELVTHLYYEDTCLPREFFDEIVLPELKKYAYECSMYIMVTRDGVKTDNCFTVGGDTVFVLDWNNVSVGEVSVHKSVYKTKKENAVHEIQRRDDG